MSMRAKIIQCLILALFPLCGFAQGTGFTYHGNLNCSGTPANGFYSLTFTLYGDTNSYSPLCAAVINCPVGVTNGSFSTTVDFGMNVFSGQNVWIEIGVATNGGTNFTILTPRQPILPVPYALYAYAAPASGLTGTIPNSALPPNPVFTGTVKAANFAGNLSGNFTGTLQPGSFVPDTALSYDVQTYNRPLNETASGGVEHILWSTETGNGSTLSLKRYGDSGYADVNFFTAPSLSQMVGNPTLHFAIGVGVHDERLIGTPGQVYLTPYLEQYAAEPFWFVTFGDYRGGFRGNGNFVVFSYVGITTTNNPMIEVDRISNTITNYSPVTFMKPPTLRTNGAPSGVVWGSTPPDHWVPIILPDGTTNMTPAWGNH